MYVPADDVKQEKSSDDFTDNQLEYLFYQLKTQIELVYATLSLHVSGDFLDIFSHCTD